MNKVFSLLILFFLVVFLGQYSYAQNEVTVDLKWEEESDYIVVPSGKIEIPNLEGAVFDGEDFIYIAQYKRLSSSLDWSFDLLSYQSSPVDKVMSSFIEDNGIEVGTAPKFQIKNIKDRGRPIAVLELNPFVKVNGQVRKVETIVFKQTSQNNFSNKDPEFALESVLKSGSGEWYKISVDKDGIYKIDYNFLNSIGVNVSSLDPADINIYGNAFGILPELNSEYRPDDLLKNDIQIVGEGDGSFDEGDYILFYGRGPHKWEESTGRFRFIRNIYSSLSTYYINIDSGNSPARIQNADISQKPATHVVTNYSSYAVHEKELRSLMFGGQRWYGEEFDAELNQSISMNIADLNSSEDVELRAFMAGNVGGSVFNFRYNGNLIGTDTVGSPAEASYNRTGFNLAPGIFTPTSSNFTINIEFDRNTPDAKGYLDFIQVNARSFLRFSNGREFRDLESVGAGNVAEMRMTNTPSNAKVWEITERTQPKIVQGSNSNGTFSFIVATDSLRQFITFDGSRYNTPSFVERVQSQNLHALGYADYLIVTHPLFVSQANRLASLHEHNGLSVHVVSTEQVYNEFSGGTQDPTAIKYFAKMFYDRAEGDVSKQPKYMLLFGDGTYDPLDRVENNNYMVPVYETENSENYVSSLVSDDYFGLLDDNESFNISDKMDIAVGRFTATTTIHAQILVDKVEHYMKNGSDLFSSGDMSCGECDEGDKNSTHGNWRQRYTLIADDENQSQFIDDLEFGYNYFENNHQEMNAIKIYSDAFEQTTTAGGERFPDVNDAIQRSIDAGSLVTCYVGHGGSAGAAQERIITVGEVLDQTNIDELTLFVSATCEFSRIDDNRQVSIGEYMALNDEGGAIALMTTSRAVYIYTNTAVTEEFFQNVFERNADNEPLTFGDIIINTKNQSSGGSDKRSFMLIGDPALTIALPYEKVVVDSVNSISVLSAADTLKALSKSSMSGHIEDQFGNLLSSYNGIVQPTIYDKASERTTLGQDANSPVRTFDQQENILFKGKATVSNGYFDFDFIVPKDINYAYGNGKATFYSWNTSNTEINAGGYSKNFLIGGIDTSGLNDQLGPEIELYLNDESFVNGGISNDFPILIAHLYDESGINTVGNGIGHDITMILDDNTSDATVLNSYYESDLDTYQSGSLTYQMDKLTPGLHTLTFKAWDVNNNSSEKVIEFTVHEEEDIALEHVLNYPNPFTTHTEFFFEHNQVCSALETQIEIFTVTGRLVRTINKLVETRGFRTEGVAWDGRDDFGDQLAKGVYVYRVTIENPDGEKTQEMQKLYLLK